MERDNLNLVAAAWPSLDRQYYQDAEQAYLRWLSEMREAGIASPTGVLICFMWLYGFASARLPGPWRWAAVLATLLWVAGALRAKAPTPDGPGSP
jgi:uncharacterized BrkB/YihY/UPF0761 family membrane protein